MYLTLMKSATLDKNAVEDLLPVVWGLLSILLEVHPIEEQGFPLPVEEIFISCLGGSDVQVALCQLILCTLGNKVSVFCVTFHTTS